MWAWGLNEGGILGLGVAAAEAAGQHGTPAPVFQLQYNLRTVLVIFQTSC